MDLRSVDIPAICLRDELGSLKFTKAAEYLETARKTLIEIYDLGEGLLGERDRREVDSKANDLRQILKNIQEFDLNKPDSTKPRHDTLEQEAKNISENIVRDTRLILTWLQQQATLKKSDAKELQRREEAARDAERKYKEIAERFEKQIRDLEAKKEQEETAHAELLAVKMAKYFESERDRFQGLANGWLIALSVGMIVLVSAVFVIAFLILTSKETIDLTKAITKFFALGVLWYIEAFLVRNFNVNSHLTTVNRHRAAVARTLEDIWVGPGTPEQKAEALKHGVEAMFKHLPIGYVRRTEKESTSPVLEIINNIPGMKSPE